MANQKRRRITQRAIAERVGVSISTVSRVLKAAPGISDQVRAEVMRSAEDMGYRTAPPGTAGGLRTVTLFGTLASLAASNGQFHADIIAGVEGVCRRAETPLTCTAIDGSGRHDRSVIQAIGRTPDHGVVFLSVDDADVVGEALALNLPTAVVNADHPGLAVDTFLPGNRAGALSAMRHLIAAGHRRILHVTHLERPTIRQRFESYRAALWEAGIDYDPDLLVDVPDNLQAEAAYATLKPLLTGRRPWFTAMFCASDLLAIGAMKALREAGLAVPADTAIVGFDDLAVAALTDPPLTTIRVPRHELGALAARRLFERAVDPSLTPIRVEIATPLVERRSVTAVADGTASQAA